MSAKWLQVRNQAEAAEILITGTIGGSFWDDSGTTEKEFLDALKDIPAGRKITVGINSEGGSVKDGLGIYNALRRRGADVTTRIDGYAVSIASVIALAGDQRISPKSSIWMIHEPWSMASGNADDFLKAAEMLEAHGETIADIYEDRTGMSREDARAKMRAETWFRGDEALAMKFATCCTEDAVALNKLDPAKYRNLPKDLLRETLLEAAPKGTKQQNDPEPSPTSDAASNSISPAKGVGNGENGAANPSHNNQGDNMDPNNAAAPTQTAENKAVMDKLNVLETKVTAQDEKIVTLEIENKALKNQPVAQGRAVVIGDAHDKMIEMPKGAERREYIIAAWDAIKKAGVPKAWRNPETGIVWNVNTVSTDLTTDLLSSTVITTLGTLLAPVRALFTEVLVDPVKPKAQIQIPMVSDGAAMQTDPTDWESGDSVIEAVAITMHEYSQSFHVTNAQLQSGTQMGWITLKNATDFATDLMKIILAPFTVANFGAGLGPFSSTNFTSADLQTIWAATSNYTLRNLVLHPSHYSKLIPVNRDYLPISQGAGAYGFNGIWFNGAWPAAAVSAGIVGFVNSPEAVALATGLPLEPPGFSSAFASVGSTTMPGLGIQVQTASWIKAGTRVQWMAYDLMLGVAKADGTAAEVILSA